MKIIKFGKFIVDNKINRIKFCKFVGVFKWFNDLYKFKNEFVKMIDYVFEDLYFLIGLGNLKW